MGVSFGTVGIEQVDWQNGRYNGVGREKLTSKMLSKAWNVLVGKTGQVSK